MRPLIRQVPNILSLSRIPLAAIFLVLFDIQKVQLFWAAFIVLAVTLLTDIIDGRIARAWRVDSTSGYLLDALGDKVFYAAILLVIAREDPSQLILAWTLIARELTWYGIRVAAPRPEAVLKYLRSISVLYAFTIRLYFGGFFLAACFALYAVHTPALISWYPVFGLIAALLGWTQIFSLSKVIAVELYCSQNDRG